MKFECPKCGQHYEVDDEYAGQTVECEKCGCSFVATAAVPPPKPSPLRPEPPPPPQYAPPPIPRGCFPCPTCGWIVAKTARNCPRCGALLPRPSATICGISKGVFLLVILPIAAFVGIALFIHPIIAVLSLPVIAVIWVITLVLLLIFDRR